MPEGRFEFELRFETIFNIVDSYSEAQKKLKKAEVTSNLDDSDEELKKRVPKKNRRISSSTEDSSDGETTRETVKRRFPKRPLVKQRKKSSSGKS